MGDSTDEMDALFNPDGFLIPIPVWSIGRSGQGVAGALVGQHPDDGKKTAILFTDEDLAKTFMEKNASKAQNYSLQCIGTSLALLGFLVILESIGVIHVIFDPAQKSQHFTVAELRQTFIRTLR